MSAGPTVRVNPHINVQVNPKIVANGSGEGRDCYGKD